MNDLIYLLRYVKFLQKENIFVEIYVKQKLLPHDVINNNAHTHTNNNLLLLTN